MIVVLANSILSRERAKWGRVFTEADICKAASKARYHALEHRSTKTTKIIGGATGGGLLVKVDLTTRGGAGRSLFLLKSSVNMIAPLLVRPKTDKLGKNLAPVNPIYEYEVQTALAFLASDLASGNYARCEI